MKRYGPVLCCLILFSASTILANKPYWQQEVRYDIRVTLDDAAYTLKGFETMIYSNNSPIRSIIYISTAGPMPIKIIIQRSIGNYPNWKNAEIS